MFFSAVNRDFQGGLGDTRASRARLAQRVADNFILQQRNNNDSNSRDKQQTINNMNKQVADRRG